jgi:5'-methylthioadenosine phosphorylase
VGSFKKDLKPCDVVLIDQFLDRTNQARGSTFFGDGVVAHINFAHPVCESLRGIVLDAGMQIDNVTVHDGGTYVNMEGPAFSTRAESLLYKSWGMDVIGMTNLQEAKLAREAGICYATLAMVTDYDCWIEGDPEGEVSVEMIVQNLNKNISVAQEMIRKTVQKIPAERDCECAHALKYAIMTDPAEIPPHVKQRLDLIIGQYI